VSTSAVQTKLSVLRANISFCWRKLTQL